MKYLFALLLLFLQSEVRAQLLPVNGDFETQYLINGKTCLKGHFKDSLPDGTWQIFSDEKPFLFHTEMNYVNGKLNGLYKVKMGNGICVDSLFYKDNRRNGPHYVFNMKGQILHYFNYKNDTLHGPFKDAKKAGNYNNGVLDSTITYFSVGEQYTAAKGTYTNGKREGIWTFTDVRTQKLVQFVNDKANGPFLIYQLGNNIYNDTLLQSASYLNEKLNGKCIEMEYKHGVPPLMKLYSVTEKYYQNDTLNGPYIKRYTNGIIAEEMTYQKGKIIGFWFRRDTSGNVLEMHHFENGHDSAEIFANGKLDHSYLRQNQSKGPAYNIQYYRNGLDKQIDTFYIKDGQRYHDQYYVASGQIVTEYHLKNGKRHGRWKGPSFEYWYKDGMVIKKMGSTPSDQSIRQHDWMANGNHANTFDEISYDVGARISPYQFTQLASFKPLRQKPTNCRYNDTSYLKIFASDIDQFTPAIWVVNLLRFRVVSLTGISKI